MSFAKIFGVGANQIVVLNTTKDDDTDVPEIQILFKPPSLGVCKVGFSYAPDDAGEKMCNEVFARMSEAEARRVLDAVLNRTKGVTSDVLDAVLKGAEGVTSDSKPKRTKRRAPYRYLPR